MSIVLPDWYPLRAPEWAWRIHFAASFVTTPESFCDCDDDLPYVIKQGSPGIIAPFNRRYELIGRDPATRTPHHATLDCRVPPHIVRILEDAGLLNGGYFYNSETHPAWGNEYLRPYMTKVNLLLMSFYPERALKLLTPRKSK